MLYSLKAGICKDCKKQQRDAEREHGPCPEGKGTKRIWACSCRRCKTVQKAVKQGQGQHGCLRGKVVQDRCYTPVASYSYDVATARLLVERDYAESPADPCNMLLQTSVRVRDALVAQKKMELIPVRDVQLPRQLADDLQRQEADSAPGKKRKRKDGGGMQRPRGSGMGHLLPEGDPKHAALEELLHSQAVTEHFPDAASDAQKVVQLGPERMRVSMRLGFCKIAGREHSSNNTFLDVTPGQVRQGCWDEECRHHPGFLIPMNTPMKLFA